MAKMKAQSESSRLATTAKLKRPSSESLDVSKQLASSVREKRKKQERITIIIVAGVISTFVFLGWLTDGRIFTAPWEAVIQFEAPGKASRIVAINCRIAKNKNTPYCLNRQAQTKREWNGIVRGGSKQAFSLHGGR
jgi:F0F1-type ATP synthase assembly protein I